MTDKKRTSKKKRMMINLDKILPWLMMTISVKTVRGSTTTEGGGDNGDG